MSRPRRVPLVPRLRSSLEAPAPAPRLRSDHLTWCRKARTRAVVGTLAAAGLLLAFASPSLADGGASIALAPTVTFGQQEFGNTANGAVTTQCDGSWFGDETFYDSFWGLPATSGDTVTVDWEANQGTVLSIYPAGTTDYNMSQATAASTGTPTPNGKDELSFTAQASGVVPMDFEAADGGGFCTSAPTATPGPYDFTVSVEHAVILAVPHITVLHMHADLAVGTHTPDGKPLTDPALRVTIQVKSGGKWMRIGAGVPVAGVARVRISLPKRLRKTTVDLRAHAVGSAYTTQSSAVAIVRTV